MVFNKPFQHQPEAIVTFNFADIAEGTGISVFYGFATETDSGLDYHLTGDATTYSSAIITSTPLTGGNATLDIDFDLSAFNRSKDIRGTATVSFTIVSSAETAGTSCSAVAVVRIRKWIASTSSEIEIASVTSPAVLSGDNSNTKELMTMPITIPKTHFRKGETLRVSVIITGTRTGGGNIRVMLGHDPRNRDQSIPTPGIVPSTDDPLTITQMIAKIPSDLDL